MRETKFRFWDKQDEVMYAGISLDDILYGGYEIETADGSGSLPEKDLRFFMNPEWFFPMQYTGLKDKNGKEIYEGDILSCNNWNPKNYEVKFIEGGFCLWNDKVNIPTDINFIQDSTGIHFEIIGNIYENPDLLK